MGERRPSGSLHSTAWSWAHWAGLYRLSEPRGDPETGFYLDRGGCGEGPALLSVQFCSLLFQAHPQSPLACMALLVQTAGIIMAVLMVWALRSSLHSPHAHTQGSPPLTPATLVMWKTCGLTCSHTAAEGSIRATVWFHARERPLSPLGPLSITYFPNTCTCLSFTISCQSSLPLVLTMVPWPWPSSQSSFPFLGQASSVSHLGPFSLCLGCCLGWAAWLGSPGDGGCP